MKVNIAGIPSLLQALPECKKRHPAVTNFLSKFKTIPITEGCIVEVTVIYPDKQKLKTNMRVSKEDIALFHSIIK